MIDDADDSAQKRHETRTRLWDFVVALNELLENTGAENQSPRFDEAVEAGEEWTDGEVNLVWKALIKALRSWVNPLDLRLNVGWQAGDYAAAPLKLSLNILRELRLLWRVDFVTNMKYEPYRITQGCCVIVDPDFDDAEVPWDKDAEDRMAEAIRCLDEREARREIARREIPAPIMEPAEHRDLAWCADRLVRLHYWLEWVDRGAPGGERPVLPMIESPPLRVVGGEAETDPKPAVDLGESQLVNSLIDAGLPTPAKLVEFMIGRNKATFEEVMLAVYGQPVSRNARVKRAQEGKLRKVIVRTIRFLTAEESKISYRFASGHILKKISVE